MALHGHRRRVACLAGALVLVALQVYLVTVRRTGVAVVTSRDTHDVGPVGGPLALTQTFAIQQAGLRAVSLVLRPAAGALPDAAVVVELSEMHGADAASGFRVVRRMSEVATGRRVEWRFSPINDSAGKTYRLRLSVPNQPVERGVLVRATRDEHYRDGVLAIGDRDLWGDAVLETDVAQGTLIQRARRGLGWPPWAVVCAMCLTLVMTGTAAYSILERAAISSPSPGTASANRIADAVAVLVVLVICITAAVQWWRLPRRAGQESGAVQLLDRFPEAAKRTSMPHLQEAFRAERVRLDSEWRCLLALPFSRVTWHEPVPTGARLRLSYGLRPDAWSGPGDGATFRIGIGHRGRVPGCAHAVGVPGRARARSSPARVRVRPGPLRG